MFIEPLRGKEQDTFENGASEKDADEESEDVEATGYAENAWEVAYSKDDKANDKAFDQGTHTCCLDFYFFISVNHSSNSLFNLVSYNVGHRLDKHKDYSNKKASLCNSKVNFCSVQSIDCLLSYKLLYNFQKCLRLVLYVWVDNAKHSQAYVDKDKNN